MTMATEDLPDDPDHEVPPGASDATVEAVGKLTEALETVERLRGRLYDLHQLTGTADFQVEDAVDQLRAAGHPELADRIAEQLVGRNVLGGRWTFQVVEEFDDGYYACLRELERTVRDELVGGRRHLYEARLKQARRSRGVAGHEATPES
ncbi:MAG: hypothetical protein ACTHK1_07710 [Actinomycetales bacterium]